MAFFAAIFGMLSVAMGLFVSISIDTPGGPSIVLVLSILFLSSILPSVLRQVSR
jgi:ABC-type Mn2+/Zn2+ transport system permease subunit